MSTSHSTLGRLSEGVCASRDRVEPVQHQLWLCKFSRFRAIFSGSPRRVVQLLVDCPKGFVPAVSASNQEGRADVAAAATFFMLDTPT